ncbi:phage tail protein [Pantoea anthophila]|uniref:phage tail protein n=1 Tax=Pantoea anthophila TaxID=470931 RepID=UPI00301D3036
MAEQYYSILTNRGKELEAASSASGTSVVIKDFVIGDGNGRAAAPDPAQTALVREVYRHAISELDVSQEQTNQWVAHLVIPADVGGFTIREVGLLTDAGELYAVANCAAIEKPVTGINVNLQFRLAVNETASIELKVATGDGLFLRQDANLSDLNSVAKALENLGLNLVGNWAAVQANGGKHSSGNHHYYMDWGSDGKLHMTVDETDVGELFTTQNPPSAKQTAAYPASGGNLNEEASVTVISNQKAGNSGDYLYAPMFRSTLKNRGGDMDFKDGASFFMRLVEHVGTLGYGELVFDGFGSINSFTFDQNGNFRANGNIYSGQSFLTGDGNVYGSVWGGWLSNWIGTQINAVNQSINSVANTANDAWNKGNDAQLNRVSDVALGARWTGILPGGGGLESPAAGYVMTGWYTEGSNPGGDTLVFRPVQKYVPSMGWVNVGHTS